MCHTLLCDTSYCYVSLQFLGLYDTIVIRPSSSSYCETVSFFTQNGSILELTSNVTRQCGNKQHVVSGIYKYYRINSQQFVCRDEPNSGITGWLKRNRYVCISVSEFLKTDKMLIAVLFDRQPRAWPCSQGRGPAAVWSGGSHCMEVRANLTLNHD